MTIEEAIEHCKDIAKESRAAALSYARENAYETAISCKACGQEHEQLAEWLIELKQRREAEITAPPKSNADRIRQMTDDELFDFLDAITDTCGCWSPQCDNCPMKYKDTSPQCDIQAWLKQEVKTNDEL